MAFDFWSIGGGKVIGTPPKLGIGALTVSPTLEGSGLVASLKSGAGDLEATATLAASGTSHSFDLIDNQGTAVTHRTGALTGASDGDQMTFSVWFKIPSLPPSGKNIFNMGDGTNAVEHVFLAQIQSTGNLYIYVKDLDGPSVKVNKVTNDSPISINTLYHLYFNCDLTAGTSVIYLNGVELTNFATNSTNTGVHAIESVAESCTTVKHDNLDAIGLDMSEFGELWFDTVTRPLSAFYDGGRVYLGEDGSEPGSQPLIYLRGDAADHTAGDANRGTGGAFALYDAEEPWVDV